MAKIFEKSSFGIRQSLVYFDGRDLQLKSYPVHLQIQVNTVLLLLSILRSETHFSHQNFE